MRPMLVAMLLMGCGGVQDETACTRMAVEVCMRQFYCYTDGPEYSDCVRDTQKVCAAAPAEKSDACAAAVHDQDCAELHAHVVPAACKF